MSFPQTETRPPVLLLVAIWCAVLALPPWDQWAQAQPPPIVLTPQEPIAGIRHHVSFMLSGGFDLDVLGHVIMGAVGQRDGEPLAIRQARPWPDVYVSVPKRPELTIGFGVFQRDEIVGRLSRARYTSEPLTDAGNIVGPSGDQPLVLDVSPYRESSWELGWRHYLVMNRRVKQYANLMGGVRTVEPIEAAFSTSGPAGALGVRRLYGRSALKTFSLELGLTYEFSRVGVFVQAGGRWQQKLEPLDDDLAEWSLDVVNDTGLRFYIPLQFGILLRL